MNYKETIDFLYSQLPAFSSLGIKAYKADLQNIEKMCALRGNPHLSFKSIHVAGTNGKGSVCHMLSSILQEAGYKTGLYTSPHIFDFSERIKINGKDIEQQFVIDFVANTKSIFDDIKPSFFEYTVLMAFEYFKFSNVDVAIIETGLGGRLDSTNIISPILSIITYVGFDHTDILGKTLNAIAEEKAGIIKPNIPVVIGSSSDETKPVFIKKANEVNAGIHFADNEYTIEFIDVSESLFYCNIKNCETGIVTKLNMDLTGIYQSRNARTVLCASSLLTKHFNISIEDITNGLSSVIKNTGIKGRWQLLSHNPFIILDVAHNQDGIAAIIDQLVTEYPNSNYTMILGFVKDKDITSIIKILPPHFKYVFTNAHMPRALSYKELQLIAANAGLEGVAYDDVNDAIEYAVSSGNNNDVIVVCGSFFVVAEVDVKKYSG